MTNMLSTLGPTPVLLIGGRRPHPVRGAKWMCTRPPYRPPIQGRIRLADGVWIITRQQRAPVGSDIRITSRRLDPPEWMAQGLCAQLTPDYSDTLFFGVERRAAPGALIAAASAARQICLRCPVAVTCLTSALVDDERYGVWGGTSGRQRAKLRIRMEKGAVVEDLVTEYLSSAGVL